MGISSQLQEREKGDLPTMPAESRPNRRPLPILHLRFPLKTGTESSHSSLHTLPSNRAAEAVYKELGFAY